MKDRSTRGRGSSATVGLTALLVLGALATVLAFRDVREAERVRDARSADLVASRLSGSLQLIVGAVRGADVLATDGAVEPREFTAFSAGIVDDSVFSALAFATRVEAADRIELESQAALEIVDTDGSGGFVTAEVRPVSFVVTDVYPENETTLRLRGFDLASDPVRWEGVLSAIDSPNPVISDRTSTAASAQVGVSLVHAVRNPDGEVVGVVTSGFAVDSLIERSGIDPSSYANVSLSMDDEPLFGTSGSGVDRTFDVAGRTFTLTLDDRRGTNLLAPILIATGTLALAASLGAAAQRDVRQRKRLERASRRNLGIAHLGQQLAGAQDAETVVDEALAHAGAVVAARHTIVVVRTLGEREELTTRHDVATGDNGASTEWLEWAVGHVRTVAAGGADRFARSAHPSTSASIVCVPLLFSQQFCYGAIGFVWDADEASIDVDERTIAATTMAELLARGLERAVIADSLRSRTGSLNTFARTLNAAHTADDVVAAVGLHIAGIVGAERAELRLVADDDLDESPSWRTIAATGGRAVAQLGIHWRGGQAPTTIQHAVLATLGELIGQTLSRTALSEQEHHVIVQLQHDLLPEPPSIEGIDVAVRYRPAMNVVGLGGDFYDVVLTDSDRAYLVIGDITGHGSEAVAAMAEVKSIMHHLLRSGGSIETVMAQADLVLARRDVFATAQIVEVDRRRNVIRYLNAGHPYPILRAADGSARLLTDGHRVLLGLTRRGDVECEVGEVPFVEGDLLVLYTDGLIERRTLPFDEVVEGLRRSIQEVAQCTASTMLSTLLAGSRENDDRIDDDVALIGVRRLG